MAIDLQKELNDKQYEAASTIEGPLLIIAGAGSGKTRMITFRIAHMLEQGIPQASILALTFTNKAAREMAHRIRGLTGKKLSNLTVSTFHAFGVKVLRKSIRHLGYKENFSIYDQNDQITLLKEAARHLGLQPENLDLFYISGLFSNIKTGRKSWHADDKAYQPLYDEYQELLHVYNAVDFDDLIILPQRIFTEFPEVLEKYRQRYRYIMVDEFQDTSLAQYKLLHLLAATNKNICVVGDDDQSIYSWRGANYQNIMKFERDFPAVREIKLEQNYRSTGNILNAANKVIANNKNRKEKELWTGSGTGKAIELFYPDNETREALFIAEMIRSLMMQEKRKYHDFGVLVRTNSLTAALEETFLAEDIPYRISGGTSFFQRKEIKDLIGYLRVIANPDDDVNLLRIINTPRRGIGKQTIKEIRRLAEEKSCSLYSAISSLRWASDSPLPQKTRQSLEDFLSLIEMYRERLMKGKNMTASIQSLIKAVDYWHFLILEHPKNERLARYKYGNVNRFVEFFERWEKDPDNLNPTLFGYLNRISLITRDDDSDEEEGKLNLMTVHASKGLEFGIVFLAGVEDHIIPHARSLEENPDNLEEERRLFYVAITRAKEKLFMTCCRMRKVMREVQESLPSRFLEEIPKELIEYHKEEEPLTADDAAAFLASMRKKWD